MMDQKFHLHSQLVEPLDGNLGIGRADRIFIEKNPHVSGPRSSDQCCSRGNCILEKYSKLLQEL